HGLYNIIQNNYLGTDTSGTRDLGNGSSGIYFWGNGIRNIFCDNIISGNNSYGISILGPHEGNIFRDNKIGIQADGFSPLPNQFSGIGIKDQVTADTIGPGNQIWYNGKYGILLEDSSVTRITITQNSITMNDRGGIASQDKANENIIAPGIGEQNPLTGMAPPNSRVEIFSDSSNQGQIYQGTVQADGSGEWTYNGNISGPKVTATATDPEGNTSEFSSPVMVTAVETTERQIPERYFLFQNYPNPFNPKTTIRFEVMEVCWVTIKVYDLRGREVGRIVDNQYQPGRYEVTFNAEGLSSGIYFYQIRMGDFQAVKKMVVMK
ncbi:MAG: T9SS type A sorting domain-containing protein, partial [bacterium]